MHGEVSVDSQTGWIYWGEVGPDAREDSVIGPKGYDEFNQARGLVSLGGPILWGIMPTRSWITKPRCLGRGKIPKTQSTYLPTTPGWSSCHPCSRVLFIIPMMPLKRFPPWAREVGRIPEARISGRLPQCPSPLATYFEGKWLAAELSRRAIFLISMDEEGGYESLERFLPDYRPVEPIDMKFGPNGDLYVLEYGDAGFRPARKPNL